MSLETIAKALHATALAALALDAHAAEKTPLEYPLKQYGLVLAIALLGGFVSFYAKVRAGSVERYHLAALIGELTTSAFAGLLCFWLAEAAGAPDLITAVLVGIAGHMGAKAITLLEQWATRKLGPSHPPAPPTPGP